MDFQNSEKILYKTDCYIFASLSFIFSLKFSISLIFRSVKPILKDSFSTFYLLKIIVSSFYLFNSKV